ncbi:hypothetical protein [Halorhabdus sp. CUG00001]|uniref:hypothetical protein n=1 Tax=Halorhabdus sp. CUG00001 TaxID=2600297 RepID=UPI00131E7950|nr:hypothetical protein [Halorhabdus sp. CUG00001]
MNRHEELTYLKNKRDQSETRVHFICGQSGIGKSDLAREFEETCEEDGYPTLFYPVKDPRNEQIFLQRLLAAWFDKYPESTVTQLREYISSSDSVEDLLSIVSSVVPDPASGLAIDGLQRAISGATEAGVDFPDPVQLVADVMKRRGSAESPAVVIIDQYDARIQESERTLESTFRDIAYHLDDSVVWFVTARTEVQGGERLDCIQLEPFDQDLVPNPGASYPEDSQPFEPVETSPEQGYEATRALVEEAGFDYEESDLIALHDRTNGVPLLIAAICEEPRAFSLREELENTPSNYIDFKNDIQQEFVRGLTENQQEILGNTSVFPVITVDLCYERTGLAQLVTRQELDELTEQGKLMRLSGEYPINPAYKCHDFYREYLIDCAGLEERALRLEGAIDCLEVAFENSPAPRDPEIEDGVAVQLDRFIYQVSHVSDEISISDIVERVVTGSSKSEEEIADLLASHLGFGHREYSLEEYLREII